jgi:DNA repair ATPase RecN
MDSKQRFDQLESLLVDLARKVDQQSEAITKQSEAIAKQGEAIGRIEQRVGGIEQLVGGIEQRLDNIEDQIGDIINIFKLSEARHTQSEQRLDMLATEIQEQGRRTDEALQIQMQMIALMRAGNNKTEALEQRYSLLENQEPRIKRLEDEVFRAAS